LVKYLVIRVQLLKGVGTMAKKPERFKPGQPAPTSGQYERVGPRGGRTGNEVTATAGEPLPPTPEPGQRYILVDKTRHKGDR
jgi:hypothetical protein